MTPEGGRGPLPPLPEGDGASVASFEELGKKRVRNMLNLENPAPSSYNSKLPTSHTHTLEDDETKEEEDPRPLSRTFRFLEAFSYHLTVASASLNFLSFSSLESSGLS